MDFMNELADLLEKHKITIVDSADKGYLVISKEDRKEGKITHFIDLKFAEDITASEIRNINYKIL